MFGNSRLIKLEFHCRLALTQPPFYTEYIVTGTTYAYYGIRVRSIATTYNGSYSDFIAAGGFDTDNVGFIINQSLQQNHTIKCPQMSPPNLLSTHVA